MNSDRGKKQGRRCCDVNLIYFHNGPAALERRGNRFSSTLERAVGQKMKVGTILIEEFSVHSNYYSFVSMFVSLLPLSGHCFTDAGSPVCSSYEPTSEVQNVSTLGSSQVTVHTNPTSLLN